MKVIRNHVKDKCFFLCVWFPQIAKKGWILHFYEKKTHYTGVHSSKKALKVCCPSIQRAYLGQNIQLSTKPSSPHSERDPIKIFIYLFLFLFGKAS